MNYWLLPLLGLLLAGRAHGQVETDPAAAFARAQATGQPVLLVFSGSDWCAPCIRLERQVLTDSTFLRYASGHVVLLKADFPQQRQLEPARQAAYEALAEKYNPEGAFPKLVVIGPDRRRVVTLSAVAQTPASLVAQLAHAVAPD